MEFGKLKGSCSRVVSTASGASFKCKDENSASFLCRPDSAYLRQQELQKNPSCDCSWGFILGNLLPH